MLLLAGWVGGQLNLIEGILSATFLLARVLAFLLEAPLLRSPRWSGWLAPPWDIHRIAHQLREPFLGRHAVLELAAAIARHNPHHSLGIDACRELLPDQGLFGVVER